MRIRQLSALCEPGVICDASPSNTEKIEREQWHFDVTHELANRGIGYSIYEFVGDMTMYINNTTNSGFPVQIHSYLSAAKPIHAHGTQAKMDPYMFAAIFGNVRPTNPR